MFHSYRLLGPPSRCHGDLRGLDQEFSMTNSPRKGANWGGRIVAAAVAAAVATAALLFALAGPAEAASADAPVAPSVSLL
jgi:hypothetical protein